MSPAGMCWLQSQDQRCDMVLMRGVTKEECCVGGRLDTAWSNASLPMNEVSLLGFLGIVSCVPCKGKQSTTSQCQVIILVSVCHIKQKVSCEYTLKYISGHRVGVSGVVFIVLERLFAFIYQCRRRRNTCLSTKYFIPHNKS